MVEVTVEVDLLKSFFGSRCCIYCCVCCCIYCCLTDAFIVALIDAFIAAFIDAFSAVLLNVLLKNFLLRLLCLCVMSKLLLISCVVRRKEDRKEGGKVEEGREECGGRKEGEGRKVEEGR